MGKTDQVDELLDELSIQEHLEVFAHMDGYESVPVGIDTFIEDDYYLGLLFGGVWERGPNKGNPKVYPYWRERLREIFPNPFFSPFTEICVTGCFTGDTKVDLLNGTSRTLQDLSEEYGKTQEKFWVLAYDTQDNSWKPSQASAGFTGIKKIVEVELDNGEVLECSYDHGFILSDNTQILAKDLQVGDSLKSSYNYNIKVNSDSGILIKRISFTNNSKLTYCLDVDKYHTMVLTAGIACRQCIGSGKSTFALVSLAYEFYRLLLIKDPHTKYGLIKTTAIAIALFTTTKAVGSAVLFSQLNDIFNDSPFFKNRLTPGPNGLLFPNKIGVVVGSRFGDALGQAIISGVMDEANFQTVRINQAIDNYNNIKRRIQSRFMESGGKVPFRFYVVSSKEDDAAFLEKHIDRERNNPLVHIIETKIWEVHWFKGIYCGRMFKLFVGDENKDPFILDTIENFQLDDLSKVVVTENNIPDWIDEGRVLEVPIEFYSEFVGDIGGSLRDIAGVSTSSSYKLYKSVQIIDKALIVPHAFTTEIIKLSETGDEQMIDFMNEYLSNIRDKSTARCLHLDLALTGDRAGMSMCHTYGVKPVNRLDTGTGLFRVFEEHLLMHDFAIAIKNIPGQEIPFFKLRMFIVYLRDTMGFNITQVSADGYASADFLQLLRQHNFETKLLSLDRTKDGHIAYKRAIVEGRVYSPKNSILRKEMREVEDVGKKIDHPDGKDSDGIPYSKDVLDATAGSFWACVENAESSMLGSDKLIEDMAAKMNKRKIFNNRF